MEGPSLFLASQQLQPFTGKKVRTVYGNTKVGKEVFIGKKVNDIFSWGKHLIFQFDNVALRTHFLLFGTFEATVNGEVVTGDYQRSREPRLALEFNNGEVKLFNCSLKLIDTSNIKETYDFSTDIMSEKWDAKKALSKTKNQPNEQIADVLLDQEIFSGVGNIIKNEVLYLTKINPKTIVKKLSDQKLNDLINITQKFSHQFLEWRKVFLLRKNLVIYQKKTCRNCGQKVIREKTGKRARWSYYCSECQPQIN